MKGHAFVAVNEGASAAELAELSGSLLEAGFTSTIEEVSDLRGLPDGPWIYLITLPVAQFITGAATEAGKKAAGNVHEAISKWRAARRPAIGADLTVKDPDTGSSIHFCKPPTVEAVQALFSLDFSAGKEWYWDDHARRWTEQCSPDQPG